MALCERTLAKAQCAEIGAGLQKIRTKISKKNLQINAKMLKRQKVFANKYKNLYKLKVFAKITIEGGG